MSCKGVCLKLKAKKPPRGSTGRYILGQKRCQVCQIYMFWSEYHCPCCGYKLRTKPRNSKYKSKVNKALEMKNTHLIIVKNW